MRPFRDESQEAEGTVAVVGSEKDSTCWSDYTSLSLCPSRPEKPSQPPTAPGLQTPVEARLATHTEGRASSDGHDPNSRLGE